MSSPLTASSTVTAEGRPSLLVLHQSKKDVAPGEYSAERLALLSSKESYEQVHKDIEKSHEFHSLHGIPIIDCDGMDIYDSSSYHDLVLSSSSEEVASRTLGVTQRATFINKDLGNVSSAGLRRDRVRIIGFIKRKPGVSLEEFQRHWGDIHSKVYTNLGIVKKNIIRYEQFHVDHTKTKEISQLLGCSSPGLSFDGVAIQEAESYEKITEVLADPEYLSVGVDDEMFFLDKTSTFILPGLCAQ